MTLESTYHDIWATKLPGQKPPDQHSIERVTWTASLLPKVPSADWNSLVDLGTGSGAMLAQARSLGYLTVGTDIDDDLIRWLVGLEYLVIKVDLNDATYPFASDHFGVVTSCDVIEHLWNPGNMLKEALRILRPGGKAFIGTPNCSNWRRATSLVRGTMFRTSGDPFLKDGGHLAYYAPTDLQDAIKNAGFSEVKLHFFKHDPVEKSLVPHLRALGMNQKWAEYAYMIAEATK